MMTHDEMIAVITHYKSGGKVEFKPAKSDKWYLCKEPNWNFEEYDYRAKTEPKSLSVIWNDTDDQILTYVGFSERDETLLAIYSSKLPMLKLTLKKFMEVAE